MIWVLKSKIHKATVTEANLNYVGSITIDKDLMEYANFYENEKVLVVSNTSGSRLETYAIPGDRGSGVICMNGASSHLIKEGEEVIIMAFELTSNTISPTIVLVDKNNKMIEIRHSTH